MSDSDLENAIARAESKVNEAQILLKQATNRLADVRAEAQSRERPTEPPEPLSVIAFNNKQFRTASSGYYGQQYHYCAITFGGRWYLSGPRETNNSYTWDQLLEFIGSKYWSTIKVLREGKEG